MRSYFDLEQGDGGIFPGEKRGELVKYILDKFAEEELSYWQAFNVLETVKSELEDACIVKGHS